jgi:hypothetical protein
MERARARYFGDETRRKHIPVWLYIKAQRLDKQAEEIKQSLQDINV